MRGLRFRLLGFPVRIDNSFWVIAVLFGYQRLQIPDVGIALFVAWIVIMAVSILIHELGHAVAFRKFGFAPEVTLFAMGGVTQSRTGGRLPAKRDVIVSLAGPVTGIAAGLLFLWIQRQVGPLTAAPGSRPPTTDILIYQGLRDLVFANLGWSILNLVPILPLDGGRTTSALLHSSGVRDPDRKAVLVSLATGVAAVAAALAFQRLFAAVLVGLITFQNWNRFQQLRKASGPEAEQLGRAGRAVQEGRHDDAVRDYHEVLAEASDDALRARAAAGLANAHLEAGRPDDAAAALERFPADHPPPPLLLASIALARGEKDEAIEIVQQSFTLRPSDETAAAYATILIRTGRLDEAERLLDSDGQVGPRTARLVARGLYSRGSFAASARAAERAWEAERGPVDAYQAARARARLGDSTAALDWLERAVDHGLDQEGLLADDPDLASVRDDPRFHALLKRVQG